MKLFKTLALLLFCVSYLSAQEGLVISYDDSQVILNGTHITNQTSINTIESLLGKPFTVLEKSDGVIYIYDNGLSFNVISDLIVSFSVNYNWDGDKNVSPNSYSGILSIANVTITKELTQEEALGLQELPLMCPFSEMCFSKDQTPGTLKAMIAFNDSQITQFGFIFNR